MKSSRWSSLFLGTVLVGASAGGAFAEDGGSPLRHRDEVRPALIAGPRIPTADIESTGSIAPLSSATAHAGLTALAPRDPAPLRPLGTAAQPPVAATHPDAAPAPAPVAPAASAPAAPEAPTAATEPSASPSTAAEAMPETGATTAAAEAPAVAAPAPVEPVTAAPAAATPDTSTQIDAVAATLPVPTPVDGTPALAPAVAVPQAAAPQAPAEVAAPTTTPSAPAAVVATPAPASPAAVAPTPAPATVATAPAAAPAATTTAPTEAAVAASLEAQQVAEAMEKASAGIVSRAGTSVERAERAALVAFYRARGWQPFFVGAQDLTPEGRTLARVLTTSDRDGLDPSDYTLPQRRAATAEARAEAEYTVAETALRFVRHLASGRFDPSRLSDLVTPHPPRPEPAAVLAGLAESRDLAATLAAWAPPHEGYRRLKAELARLRSLTETPVVRLPDGPLLAPGQKDERVALLRERLGVAAVTSDADPETYDPALAEAVKAFQRERGISPSGKIGRTTLAALNEEAHGTADVIADVIVNMERWRWLPRDLGELNVFVNIPDFHLDVMKDGRSIHHARIITGRPENQTPLFSETMEYVVVNPYWNVPYSIVKKEMLTKLQAGGSLGGSYEVEVGNRSVDPAAVDWTTVSAGQVSIRQRPGDGNALGNIKFMFPNQHSVYIHDTSSRSLFTRDYRALSHGCVRVAEPFSFADALLSEEPDGLDGSRLKKLLGRGERQINLQRRIPVHMTYFTEFVDDAGQLQSRRDVYGHDAKMRRILGL